MSWAVKKTDRKWASKGTGILPVLAVSHNARRALGCRRKLFCVKYLRERCGSGLPPIDDPFRACTRKPEPRRFCDSPEVPLVTIHSIQVGKVRSEGELGSRDPLRRHWTTGFYKLPVMGPVNVGPVGIDGDFVADTVNHGGPDKAILCYAGSHYLDWNSEYPDLQMGPGALGENLTIDGVTEADVCIGDRYQAGTCQFQVSQPRQPCWKISRRWGVKTLIKEVAKTGRTGWYLRVLQPGQLNANDEFRLQHRPHPEWSVARANDVLFGRLVDRLAVIELMNLSELADDWRRSIA
jgi:MOSC domain-containing protein YiiM